MKVVLAAWGGNMHGELGHGVEDREQICALPHGFTLSPGVIPRSIHAASSISAFVSTTGNIYIWGGGSTGRLGHGTREGIREPTQLPQSSFAAPVTRLSLGETHALARTEDRCVYAWGTSSHGALGSVASPALSPSLVDVPDGVASIEAGYHVSLALCGDGNLYGWGWGAYGAAGTGTTDDARTPIRLLIDVPVVHMTLGSLHAGALCADGSVWMWGYGLCGALGTGTRRSSRVPIRLTPICPDHIVCLAAAVGLLNPPAKATKGGTEGPRTFAVTESGTVYAWGSSHKGALGNMAGKVLSLEGSDELLPYKIGGVAADSGSATGYLDGVVVTRVLSAGLHSALLDSTGRVWVFGCGSTGRMGVQRYLEGLHGGRSRMKCYISTPTLVNFDSLPVGRSRFSRGRVLEVASSRRHMLALVALPPKTAKGGN